MNRETEIMWETFEKFHEKRLRKEREEREKIHPTIIDPVANEGGRDWGIAFSQD
jgi:hypothetical protein